ncbi:hypothetical protein AOLI_G00018060 [Acnodon oligacanthus]
MRERQIEKAPLLPACPQSQSTSPSTGECLPGPGPRRLEVMVRFGGSHNNSNIGLSESEPHVWTPLSTPAWSPRVTTKGSH